MRKKHNTNDRERLSHLITLLETRNTSGAEESVPIPDPLLTEIEQMIPIYEASIRQRNTMVNRRKASIRKRKAHLERLERMIRTAWWVIRHRVKEGTIDETDLIRYGFTQTGKRSDPNDPRVWVTIGKQIIDMNQSATQPIEEPSTGELTTAIEAAEAAISEVQNTELGSEDAKRAHWTTRAAAVDLLRKVNLTLKLELRNMDPIRKRQLLRALGFRYETNSQPITELAPAESETNQT